MTHERRRPAPSRRPDIATDDVDGGAADVEAEESISTRLGRRGRGLRADDEGEDDSGSTMRKRRADLIFSCNDPAQRQDGFAEAKVALGRSGLVVIPTDTVYGRRRRRLRPDRSTPDAARQGEGPADAVAGPDRVDRHPAGAGDQREAGDPRAGPGVLARGLTLICRQQPSLSWDLGDSRSTVALRMPDHADALDLLNDNGPLAVSSANLTGEPPATTVEEAYRMLGESVDVYLDAGPTAGAMPSTIVDATGDDLVVVRRASSRWSGCAR